MALRILNTDHSLLKPHSQPQKAFFSATAKPAPAAQTAASPATSAAVLAWLDTKNPYLTSRSKRAIDLFGASMILLLLAPLLILVAALVAITSPGPVLFRQTRCGLGGRSFTIYKFRSMYASPAPEATLVQARRDDPRVTPIGRFLRRTSIDELPQLFNVIRGDMSLVGPRPHALAHDVEYSALIPYYVKRFAAKPGLSGLAQVSGARGETPTLADMKRRIRLDLVYISSASFLTDARLIIATVKEVFFSRTAF